MPKWPKKRDEPVPPEEIQAAREALGWSQEQLAEAVGVLAAEVAAWESGAIAVSPYQRDLVRWHLESAARGEQRPQRCAWWQAQEPRWTQLEGIGPHFARRARVEQQAHQRECPECERAAALVRDMPRPPAEPLSLWDWAWLIAFTLFVGSSFVLPLTELLPLCGAIVLGTYLDSRLERFSQEHPYLESQVVCAVMAAAALAVAVALGDAPSPGQYPWIAVGSVVLGFFIGNYRESTLDEEAELLAAMKAAEGKRLYAASGADALQPAPEDPGRLPASRETAPALLPPQ